jgi:hypothetical protein
MRGWLSAGICALIVSCFAIAPVQAQADTGTYSIKDYHVRLEPQDDGNVRITITMSWLVESGSIPWITVGLPNNHFKVESEAANAAKISAESSTSFTGVRIDLDKSYTLGQTFNVEFTVLASNLLERIPNKNIWQIDYTPGWYDNSFINHMQIDLVSPVSLASYQLISPMATSESNGVISWEKYTLVPGQHFNVTAESYDGSFLTQPNTTIPAVGQPFSTFGESGFPWAIVVFVLILGAIVMLVIWASIRAQHKKTILIAETEKELAADPKKKEAAEKGFEKYVEDKGISPDEQGRYYDRSYGNYVTPAIWAAILVNNNNKTPPISGGHGSCACACVSCACACACACAGGGAAGCTKKGFHECASCVEQAKSRTDKV